MKNEMNNKEYTITKKIAKHGKQIVIIIPSILQNKVRSGMLVEVKITILNDNSGVELK